MGDLEQTLETVAKRVRSLLAKNGHVAEENTKAALIDPILQALGWEIHDPDEVHREYRHKSRGNPVDYASLIAGTPEMFLEAKPLDANLREYKWRSQVVNYANAAGVDWCVLTDGNFWQVYKSNAKGDLDRKLFLETWLHSPEGRTAPFAPVYVLSLLCRENLTQKIERVWQALYVDRAAESILQGLIRDKDPSLVRLLVKRGDLTKRDVEAWVVRATVTVETSLAEVPPPEPPKHETKKRKAAKKRKPPLVPGLPSELRIAAPLLRAIIKRGGEVKVREQGAEIDEELAGEFGLTREQ
jgi:hypothetical protein